ncbi:MAG TPA: hypothetical protein VMV72_17885 [Verrucomicrobiae bacterium]|nr:hypothetical protein [Verrucomicrobiae bacterium]
MKRSASAKDWLPLAKRREGGTELPTGEAFRGEWIDFQRGIRVGNIEPHERITQILKFHLEGRYRTPFVTDRWGRGVYWQWICWLPRANREAKPISHDVNFGCAKLFISADSGAKIFKSGLQIERGYMQEPEPYPGCLLKDDWDWHRLMKQCADRTELDGELRRLLKREGFVAEVGNFEANTVFAAETFTSARQLRDAAKKYTKRDEWCGFQLYYPMPEREVRASSGYEVVKAVCGVFDEVTPAMNCCMQVPLVSFPEPSASH